VLHQQVYYGIFTEVSTDLECFTSVIQAVCYYEIVSGFGCIKLALEACGRYFCNADGVYVMLQIQRWERV
jgi:hypothetical protein